MSTWVGLADESGAYPDAHLAQDGTTTTCVNSGCTPDYFAWYELLSTSGGSGAAVKCTSSNGGAVTISGGDTIFASATNEAQYYGSSYDDEYEFYIDDSTSATSCYVSGQTYSSMTVPTYADFIVENPLYCNGGTTCYCYYYPYAGTGCDSLDKFNTVPFSTAFLQGGSTYGYINQFSASSVTMAGCRFMPIFGSNPARGIYTRVENWFSR